MTSNDKTMPSSLPKDINNSEPPALVVTLPITSSSGVLSPSNKTVKDNKNKTSKTPNIKKSYTQISKANISSNINNILHVKEAFPELSANKVGKIIKAKNGIERQMKPKINMTTRGLFRKQIIISIAKSNTKLIINSANIHISNVNKCLNKIKSDIIADFIYLTNNGIIITMNKLVNASDLSTIEKYLKNIQNVNSDSIKSPHLPQVQILPQNCWTSSQNGTRNFNSKHCQRHSQRNAFIQRHYVSIKTIYY